MSLQPTSEAGYLGRDGGILESVLLERTDILERERAVLAIAPAAALDSMLAALGHLDYRRAAAAAPEQLPFVAESFDVAVGDAASVGPQSLRPLRELARMLRPGGRLILSVAAGDAGACAARLAASGFFVARAHEGDATYVLLAVRGEFAAAGR